MASKIKEGTCTNVPDTDASTLPNSLLQGNEGRPCLEELPEWIQTQEKRIQFLEAELEKALRDRRNLEQSYIKNREVYLLAIEATNLGIYDTKVRDEDLELKENWLARLGYDPKLATDNQLTWEGLIYPDDYERVTTLFHQEEEGKFQSLNMEYRIKAANGDWRWIIESSKVIEDASVEGGKRIVGTHFDITERKLAEEAERNQRAFAEALTASASNLNSTLNLNELLNLILVNVSKVVPLDDSDIWLIDRNKRSVYPAYRKGNTNRVLPVYSVEFPVDDIPLFKEISLHRKPVYLADIQPDQTPIPTRNPDQRSCVCIPISFASRLLGFLVIYSLKKDHYTPLQIEHLQAFANQAATAIRNAQLYARAQEAAALDERQRLAREMHDVISQTLFSASIKAEALMLMLDTEKQDVVRDNLVELHRLTRGALAEMRTLLLALRPNAIINTDLSNLLQHMVDGLAGRTTAEIQYSSKGRGLLPPEVQTIFFRIAQETINNVLKHARAHHVAVNFINECGRAILRITDDGCGFDPKGIPSDRMGVKITARARRIDPGISHHREPAECRNDDGTLLA